MPIAKKTKSGRWSCIGRVDKSINPSGYKHFTADTKAEAERLANEAARGIVEKRKNMTVGEAIDQYIKDRENVLSPATVRGYKALRRSRLASIMHLRVFTISQIDIQRVVNAESKTCSPKTIRNAHGLLVAALSNVNPSFVVNTKLPSKKKPEICIPTKEQLDRLIQASSTDSTLHLAIVLASQLGLRRSEICALTPNDVYGNDVIIKNALVRGDDGHWKTKQPKSYSGYRTLHMTKGVKDAIASFNCESDQRYISVSPDVITIRFENLLKANPDIPHFRFHDLRHYYASVMLSLNVPNKYAMELMGHATDNMLKTVYQHTMEDKKKEVAKTIEAYFDGVQQ